MAPAMQPAEIQFAQRLASHEKGIRDRAVKKLRQYISVKTQRETGGFSQEELLKIWKGLFYCMWVQNEPLLQEELANTISQLIHVVNNSEAQHLFIQTFWQTVNREWPDIDGLRLDKYHMLIRLVLRQSFEVLKRNGWEESRIKLFLDVLMKEILHPESQSPNGVKFHFIDIYLGELSKVGGKELLADQNLKFIDPFCKVAAKTKDQTLVQTIARGVFEVIVDQSPFVPEESVEEQKTKVGDSDLSEEETSGNEMTWRKAISRKKTALGRYHSGKEGVSEEDGRDGGGSVEDAGLLLQFDYKAVADRLLEITNRKNIPPFNRKRLSKLIKKFRDLSEGSISHLSFAEDASADEDDQTLSQGRHKKKGNRLLETDVEREKGTKVSPAEEEESAGSVPKRKRKKKKKNHLRPEHLGPGGEAMCPERNGSPEPEAGPGRAREASAAELGTVASPGPRERSGSEPASVHSRRKRLRKRSLRVQVESPEGADPEGADPAGGAPVLKRRRELGALLVNGSGPPTLAWPLPKREGPPASPADRGDCPGILPQGGKLKKRRGEPGGLDLYDPSAQKAAILKKRKKMKEMSKLAEHRGVKLVQAVGISGALSPLKKQLRTQKDFVKFDASSSPKPLFFRKAKGSGAATSPGPGLQPHRTPSSSKKVTFGLNRNTTAEFKKTDKSILVSPTGPSRVAFNPEQRPLHGVLKTPSSSPASAPLGTKKPLTGAPKRRPTAVDFF
ncbi:ribosomal RNA processing protein 1 homolog B isoform X2 [Physeter macrocephalus]|uniref:Ribosomal RNA processing protein 1 homolog B isoform X2 n=1 Tax=Physeter macrocephalus TaxID=9755 RepID=A0A455BI53_PHYMC|nr:ribosomal RNA processing protein 1 homolog B isoform X2 [Physeter catodon]|eukprot:XP_028348494.1 ribosomal RNA processing protein 1 homolog B isoform X2 [Physeter catodon]